MKIAYIAAGAAGMYCGNCLRDHALALALRPEEDDSAVLSAAARFAAEEDSAEWAHRLDVYGLDLRDMLAIEAFVEYVNATYDRLDALVRD